MRRVILATLLSSLTLIAAAAPVTHSEDDASAPTSRSISTGVTSPRLVYSKHIDLPSDELPAYMGGSAKIALKIKLDETGSPTNIRVLHSINPEVDARVVEAVQQFRWAPALLNNKPVPIDLTLNVEIHHSL
jgi:periplasmic protein TonB